MVKLLAMAQNLLMADPVKRGGTYSVIRWSISSEHQRSLFCSLRISSACGKSVTAYCFQAANTLRAASSRASGLADAALDEPEREVARCRLMATVTVVSPSPPTLSSTDVRSV